MVDGGPLAWTPIRRSTDRVEYNAGRLKVDVNTYDQFRVTSRDGLFQIESPGRLIS